MRPTLLICARCAPHIWPMGPIGLPKTPHVLWISDSPDTPSGFGNVTRFVCEGLAKRGHRVSILGWQTPSAHDWRGCTVFPSVGKLGADALFPILVRHRPDIVIALADVWWLPYFNAPHIRRQMEMTDTPWALYFPIDGALADDTLPPSWIELLREVDIPIAMSRYGRRIAENCGVAVEYIPHGVDLDIFTPPNDRAIAKQRVGAAGKFLVLADCRNQPRKMLPRLLDIFARFARGRDDVVLHLHTDPNDDHAGTVGYSYKVRADIEYLGLTPKVRFTPGMVMRGGGGVPITELALYYQAADVHLLASSGEGFGLPTLQAAAAGAVPFAGAYSASQELAEGHGEAVAISDWTETEFGVRRAFIDIADCVERLERYYADRALLRDRSAASRAFAQAYGWDQIVDQWDFLIRSAPARRRLYSPARQSHGDVSIPTIAGLPLGVRVDLKMARHDFGRLESAIAADAGGQASDVKIPTLPKAGVVGGVKAIRRPGQVCLALADAPLFLRLRAIFPILSAWTPRFETHEDDAEAFGDAPATIFPISTIEEARLGLAQSVLLLNVAGEFSSLLLADAAVLGIPCVGVVREAAQRTLWPDLVANNEDDAMDFARRILTDAAFAAHVVDHARAACRVHYAYDEDDIADWLRRLSIRDAAEPGAG